LAASFLVKGQQRLTGKITINGAKNSALALLPAALLTEDKVKLDNLPCITDIDKLLDIIRSLGASVDSPGDRCLCIDGGNVDRFSPPDTLVNQLRASYYLMGSLLGRFGRAEIPLPGGCDLGPRPIDQHIKGFSAMGAKVEMEHGFIKLTAGELRGANIYLDVVSVGATINIMLAAVKAEGRTVIENAAREPEIVDVANFLNGMGAQIRGAGTDVIKIQGVKNLHAVEHSVIPDRIEAGTFMIAAAATNGEVMVEGVIPRHLEPVSAKLKEVGVTVEAGPDFLSVKGADLLLPCDVKTFPYPGFPTDLQPHMMVLLLKAPGVSLVTENIFERRFGHIDELRKMGARITLEGRTAIIEGGHNLTSASLRAMDLRGGAAFIIAGLMAAGDTVISNVKYIDRGYERIEERFQDVGVTVERMEDC